MTFEVGDIVRYERGKYGIVVKYEKSNVWDEDVMHVVFFHEPEKTFRFFLSPAMKACWIKVG
jgi:hypothetical protein